MTTLDTGGVSMTWAHGPVVTRRRLGGELKRLREGAELKLEDVARALECSTSKISRLETGKGIPRWRDVRDMLDVYRVPEGDLRTRLLDWAQTGRARMWWQEYADVLPPVMATYVELEWDAARIQAYECYIVHGLLQTRDYARGVLRNAYGSTRSEPDIERLVDVRMRRQEALASGHGLDFVCILDESTLYRVVESPSVLRAQLEHLVSVARAHHVDIRVLPFSAGLLRAGRESFSSLGFGDIAPGTVYLERPGSAGEFVTERTEVTLREADVAKLHAASQPEEQSIPLIERAIRFLDT